MTSSLYRELTDNELTMLVSEALRTELISAHLLTGGLFNTTYLAETKGCGKTILRVGPVNRHLLMPFEHHLMEAEESVYSLCGAQGIPTSEIILSDTSKTLLDRDFMFVRYIPSHPMSEMELDPRDREHIVRDIGAAAAKLHGISAPRFGRITDVGQGGGFSRWSDALIHELSEWEKVGVPAQLYSPEEHREIRLLFQKAAPCLDEIKKPRLVHTDLWLGNILIRTDTERPEFAAVIDADRALWGDTDFEFSSIQWTYGEAAFWEGYGRPLARDDASRIRRAVYTLLNRLWNSYVYQAEYNEPENAAREAEDARLQMAYLREAFSHGASAG